MFKRLFLGFLAILLIGSTYLYFAYLRPIPPFIPTGEYNVGATNFDFTYESDVAGSSRTLNIRTWYPTDATTGELNVVTSERTGLAALQIFGMPESFNTVDESLSYRDAPIADGDELFPVILFNHGFASFAEQNTVNMQELASHGYILLSISHPGTSLVTEYTDGSHVMYDQTLPAYQDFADIQMLSAVSATAIQEALTAIDDSNGFDEYWSAMRRLASGPAFGNMQPILQQWVEDSNILVNVIADSNFEQFSPIIADRLDSAQIGILGHSLGGMTAVGTSVYNGSIGAVINMDAGFLFDIPAEQAALNAPTCFLMGDQPELDRDGIAMSEINIPLLEQSEHYGCNAVFRGAAHMNFGDLNYVSFLKLLPTLRSVDQQEFGIELNNFLVSFFDQHLKSTGGEYVPAVDGLIDLREF